MTEGVDQTVALQKAFSSDVILSRAVALAGELSTGAFDQAVQQVRTLAKNGPIYPPR